jgi:hypothetical protein
MNRFVFVILSVIGLFSSFGNTVWAGPLPAENAGVVVSDPFVGPSHGWSQSLADETVVGGEGSSVYFDLTRLAGIELVSSCGPVDKPCCRTVRVCKGAGASRTCSSKTYC